jgi:hypothetical protein
LLRCGRLRAALLFGLLTARLIILFGLGLRWCVVRDRRSRGLLTMRVRDAA